MTAFLGSNRSIPLADAIARYGAERLREALVAKRAVAIGREGLPDPAKTPPERVGIPAAAWDGAAFLPDSCARLADGRYLHDVKLLVSTLSEHSQENRAAANQGRAPRFSAEALRAWYRLRVGTWPPDAPPPSETDDRRAARAYFAREIPRDLLREVRRGLAPSHWKKPGKRRGERAG